MLTRDEIEKRLQGVSAELCAAFAVRSALRVLPLLAVENDDAPPFWYWPNQDRGKHFLAVLHSLQLGKAISIARLGNRVETADASRVAAAEAEAAAEAARVAAATRVAEAATKAVAAARAAEAVYLYADDNTVYADARAAECAAETADYAAAAYADDAYAAYATYAADARVAYNNSLLEDLDVIAVGSPFVLLPGASDKSQRKQITSAVELFQRPLWPVDELPALIQAKGQLLRRWAESLESGFEYWLDWYEDYLDGKPVDVDLLEKQLDIPAEIRDQGPGVVNTYLTTLASSEEKGELKPLNLVRAIFIGNGAAGKTSLIRALHNEPVIEGEEEMTPGIAIREWPVEGTAITARLWDFGGQVMSHSTHQFFLRERCLYILVLDARTEINANDQAEYWLEHVKVFGKNAAVMLVGNKCDQAPVNLDMRALKEKYPNIVDFYSLSCTRLADGHYKSRYETFRADLIEQLQKVGTHQVYFTENQFSMLQSVRERSLKNAFLSHDEFDQLCEQYTIGGKGELSRDDFLGLLDKLGEVIHFPGIPRLDSYVLNPRWLSYGVYTLLYSDEVNNKPQGELNEAQVIKILQAKHVEDEHGKKLNYPPDKCGFIIDAMEEFKLSYRLQEDRKRFVIPDKLPAEQPELDFDKLAPGTLAFEFDFRGFLPRHVMPTLIVARHDEIVNGQVWLNGVVLCNKKQRATARVQVDHYQRLLRLWVQGDGAREMLAILMDEVTKIIQRMETLEVKEVVLLPASARRGDERLGPVPVMERAPYQQLLAMARRGDEIFTSELGQEYNLSRILGVMMSDEKKKEEQVTININGSVGAFGVGDQNTFSGQVTQHTVELKEAVTALDGSLNDLMPKVISYDTDAAEKMAAFEELQKIRTLLENTDSVTPEQKKELGGWLSKIKDGSLGALALAKKMKESEKTITWVVEKAGVLSRLLVGLNS